VVKWTAYGLQPPCVVTYNSGMEGKNLFVVIPVYNGWAQTQTCLEKLRESTCRSHTVIVVDHGSTDETRTELERKFPEVLRLEGTSDMWWSAATNLGIRAALDQGAELIMLLNNDCYVEPDTLSRLLELADKSGRSVIAPVQRSAQNGRILTRRVTTCFLLGLPTLTLPGRIIYHPDRHGLVATGLIIGGRGALIPSAVFRSAGLFNERDLPHYGADHDFYLRCRKLGIGLFIAAGVVVDVDERRSTLSARPGEMPLARFLSSLGDRRSHRNLPELRTLFRLHYPVPGLYMAGVALNLLRYILVYASARLLYLAGCRQQES